MEYLLSCVGGVLEPSTLGTMAWNEVELGLHLLFLMEELVSSTASRRQAKFAGAAPADPAVATDILDRGIHVMLASGVDQYAHSAVVQQHFEGGRQRRARAATRLPGCKAWRPISQPVPAFWPSPFC